MTKKQIADILEKVGLHRLAFRLYEARVAMGPAAASCPAASAADGLPVPPARLLVKVTGTPDPEQFLRSGAWAAEAIRDALARAGVRMDSLRALLDFGCGCGRVLRHWQGLASTVEIHGSDYNAELTGWCAAHLPFARIGSNRLEPPLHYAAGQFDLIYALSVFTHLSEPLQDAWLVDLGRVLRPGGYLLITTHGEYFAGHLTEPERAAFAAGHMVTRYGSASGSNLCSTYHPEAWLRARLTRAGFAVVEFVPAGAKGNPGQDLYLLRRERG
ncbi:MAG: class I SAM-dependent methyltransferase [Bryobacterales bacterium]|nr:class I SAM-dependent methyltransferase [Bryobacterales bacterium]